MFRSSVSSHFTHSTGVVCLLFFFCWCRSVHKKSNFDRIHLLYSLYIRYTYRLDVLLNFNKAVQVTVPQTITLNKFKSHITKTIAPQAQCMKIYFNGLQLQYDDHTLANYGILDRSTVYVNTENVIGEKFIERIL